MLKLETPQTNWGADFEVLSPNKGRLSMMGVIEEIVEIRAISVGTNDGEANISVLLEGSKLPVLNGWMHVDSVLGRSDFIAELLLNEHRCDLPWLTSVTCTEEPVHPKFVAGIVYKKYLLYLPDITGLSGEGDLDYDKEQIDNEEE